MKVEHGVKISVLFAMTLCMNSCKSTKKDTYETVPSIPDPIELTPSVFRNGNVSVNDNVASPCTEIHFCPLNGFRKHKFENQTKTLETLETSIMKGTSLGEVEDVIVPIRRETLGERIRSTSKRTSEEEILSKFNSTQNEFSALEHSFGKIQCARTQFVVTSPESMSRKLTGTDSVLEDTHITTTFAAINVEPKIIVNNSVTKDLNSTALVDYHRSQTKVFHFDNTIISTFKNLSNHRENTTLVNDNNNCTIPLSSVIPITKLGLEDSTLLDNGTDWRSSSCAHHGSYNVLSNETNQTCVPPIFSRSLRTKYVYTFDSVEWSTTKLEDNTLLYDKSNTVNNSFNVNYSSSFQTNTVHARSTFKNSTFYSALLKTTNKQSPTSRNQSYDKTSPILRTPSVNHSCSKSYPNQQSPFYRNQGSCKSSRRRTFSTTLHQSEEDQSEMFVELLRQIDANKTIEDNRTRSCNETTRNNRTSFLKDSKFFKVFQKALGGFKGKIKKFVLRNSTRFQFRRKRSTPAESNTKTQRTKATWDYKRSTKYSKRFLRLLHRRRPDLWVMLKKPTVDGATTTPINRLILPTVDADGNLQYKAYTVTMSRFQRFRVALDSYFVRDEDDYIVPHQEVMAFLTDMYHVIRRTTPPFPPWMFTYADNTHMVWLYAHGKKSKYVPKRDSKRRKRITFPSTTLSKWRQVGNLIYNYFWTTRATTTPREAPPPLRWLINMTDYFPHHSTRMKFRKPELDAIDSEKAEQFSKELYDRA